MQQRGHHFILPEHDPLIRRQYFKTGLRSGLHNTPTQEYATVACIHSQAYRRGIVVAVSPKGNRENRSFLYLGKVVQKASVLIDFAPLLSFV
jgi:hypothetical protein